MFKPLILFQMPLSRGYVDSLCMDGQDSRGLNGLYVFKSVVLNLLVPLFLAL